MRYFIALLFFIPTLGLGQDCSFNSINIDVTGSDSEIGWSIAQDNGWAIVSGALGSVSDVCIEDGCFPFNMYDGNGDDGWNETTITISYSLTNEIIFSGTLNDGLFESINIQIGETVLCPVYGCTDLLACNYDADATIQSGSYGDGVLNFEWTSAASFFTYIEISYTVNGVTYFGEEAGDVSLEAGTYAVTGYDSWGDGWNGGELTITDTASGASVVLIVEGAEASVDIEVTGAFFSSCIYQEEGYTCDSLCSEDLSGDGVVGVQDLLLVLSEFGCTSSCENDLNQDGSVAVDDILQLLSGFGNACENPTFQNCGDVILHEGYDYSTVQIGDQCWFAENCRYLPEVSYPTDESTTVPYYYVFDYEGTDVEAAVATSNYETYGVLYNWPAVMTSEICPSGWHIPSDEEWQTLEIFLGMSESSAAYAGCCRGTDQGYQMKSTTVWGSIGAGSNTSGLTCLPGGFLNFVSWPWNQLLTSGYWWTSSENNSDVWYRSLSYSSGWVYRSSSPKSLGFSARCLQD